MKKSFLFVLSILWASMASADVPMPYIMQYKVDSVTIHHNIDFVDEMEISDWQTIIDKNNRIYSYPLEKIDTINVFQDFFREFETPVGGWDAVLFSSEQIFFYKDKDENDNGCLLNLCFSDSVPDGCYTYVSFNEDDTPAWVDFNGESYLFIEEIRSDSYSAILVNKDLTTRYFENIPLDIDIKTIERPHYDGGPRHSRFTMSRGQYHATIFQHFMGGVNMVAGGAMILAGCSMLIPGVNIITGAVVAIGGAATFIGGAIQVARATDQLVSDGSHTEMFDAQSEVTGTTGFLAGFANASSKGQIFQNVLLYAANEAVNVTAYILARMTDINEVRQRVQEMLNSYLKTGEVTDYNPDNNSVDIHGSLSFRMNNKDYAGILLTKDDDEATFLIENCKTAPENSYPGEFAIEFSDLEPGERYYYRSYYYSTEYSTIPDMNPYFVAERKSFVMPGVKNLGYKPVSDTEYDVKMNVQWPSDYEGTHIIGVCYSTENEKPTVDDKYVYTQFNADGPTSVRLSLPEDKYYYRPFAFIGDKTVYGHEGVITNERRMLEKFYYSAGGDNWTENTNWCTDAPLNEWYGVYMNSIVYPSYRNEEGFVDYLNLVNNNLTGDAVISDLNNLVLINIGANELNSFQVINCPAYVLYMGFMPKPMKSLEVHNCGSLIAGAGGEIKGTDFQFLEIDDILLDEFNGGGYISIDYLKTKNITLSNSTKGRIDIMHVFCDNFYIYNSKIQYLSTYYNTSGYKNTSIGNLKIVDSTVTEFGSSGWRGINYISLENVVIEGRVFNISGSGVEVNKYILCTLYPWEYEDCNKHNQ